MALIPVRSAEPINGEHFVTEVGEEHLERWPGDYVRLEGDELTRYELAKAGVHEDALDAAVEAATELAAAGDETPAVDEQPAVEAPVAPEPSIAKHAAAVDPSVSAD